MATIIRSSRATHKHEEGPLQYLAEVLPDDCILVPSVRLAYQSDSRETDIVLLKPDGVVTIELKGWFGRIEAEAAFADVKVGRMPQLQPCPMRQANVQAQKVGRYMKRADVKSLFMPERHFKPFVHPILLFTHPDAEIALHEQQKVTVLHIDDEDLVSQIMGLKFGKGYKLNRNELEDLANVLLNKRVPTKTETRAIAESAATAVVATVADAEIPDTVEALDPPSLGTQLTALELVARRDLADAEQDVETWSETLGNELILESPTSDDMDEFAFAYVPSEASQVVNEARPKPRVVQTPWWRSLVNLTLHTGNYLEEKVTRVERMARPFEAANQGLNAHELARHVERRMNNTVAHLIRRTIAHNHFVIYLPSSSYVDCLPYKGFLEQELCQTIETVVTGRGYELLGDLQIEIREMSQEGQIMVDSAIVEQAKQPEIESKTACLVADEGGELYPLANMVTIGRSRDCDIYLGRARQRQRISQNQARICWENGRYVVYDGGGKRASTNGTFVNGEPVGFRQGTPLSVGDVIQCGRLGRRHSEGTFAASFTLQGAM